MAEPTVPNDGSGVFAPIQSIRARIPWLAENRLLVLRWILVFSQAVTIAFTWSLWHVRERPPILPISAIPQISVGIFLLGTLALTLRSPRAGVAAHCAVLLYAFVADQTRIQPEIVSLALLLIGTMPSPLARTVGRGHLISLWIWSGLNKALSLDFMKQSALWIFNGLPIHPTILRPAFGWIILSSEILIGICLLVRRLRRVGIVLAFLVHGTILLVLLRRWFNPSVWPWNAALPVAAAALFWQDEEDEARRLPARSRAAVLTVLLLMPVGFYGGYVDAYLAHNLYSDNTASAVVCAENGGCSTAVFREVYSDLRAPLPPETRVFTRYFEEVCRPGERLIVYPRRVRLRFGRDTEPIFRSCPAGQR
jgi:methylamine utilization protein MauE